MWNYLEIDAWDTVTLHDCVAESIRMEENDLIIDFPDGFRILPNSPHSSHDTPVRTGPAQLCFREAEVVAIDLFPAIHLFRREILCRKVPRQLPWLTRRINGGTHRLEFLWEYRRSGFWLYTCWLWQEKPRRVTECQFEIRARGVEYRWNDIHPQPEY